MELNKTLMILFIGFGFLLMIGAVNAVNYIFDDLNVTGYVNATQFNGPLAWSDLTSVPAGFADGIDNDTTYSALSEFTNDEGFITDVVNDTTPTLGGNLDAGGNDITNVNNLTLDTTAGNSNVYYNGSCTIISGPTSQLVVC